MGTLHRDRSETSQGVFESSGTSRDQWACKGAELRFYGNINEDRIEIEGNTLTYTAVNCRVQTARARKGMPFHPCKPVGLIEYSGFAKTIDDRFACECINCYPEITDDFCCCKWKFTLEE